MKVLFIGNSATYVHEIPKTLERLALAAGEVLEIEQITAGGLELSQHADPQSVHGKKVIEALDRRCFDYVFLQEHGNCIISDEKRMACANACRRLIQKVRASGATPGFYVRPPYGKDNGGYNSLAQCERLDALFGELSRENGGVLCVHANRLFERAIRETSIPLWGEDNGHTSLQGAYLIVCGFFIALFHRSATCLDANGLDESDAKTLQHLADRLFGNLLEKS